MEWLKAWDTNGKLRYIRSGVIVGIWPHDDDAARWHAQLIVGWNRQGVMENRVVTIRAEDAKRMADIDD